MSELDDPGSQGTLHGWKDIAAYFGKTARTVQRWEHSLGLPVHRISTPEGRQIIYAQRAELSQWLRTMDNRQLGENSEPPTTDENHESTGAGSVGAGAAAAQEHRDAVITAAPRWRGLIHACVLVLVTALGVYAGQRWASMAPPPSIDHLEYAGKEIRALSLDGQVIWTHDVGEVSSSLPARSVVASRVDIDGNGQLDFIVPVRRGAPGTARPDVSDAVIALSDAGRLLWTAKPDTVLTLGEREFRGPWHLKAVASSAAPGRARVWLAFSHHTWNPGIVFEIAPNGRSELRYVQKGWVTALAHWRTPGGDFLAIGGVNNDYERPSLTLLKVTATAQSPQLDGRRFECDGCPTGLPEAHVLLPDSDVSRAGGDPYPFVDRLLDAPHELGGTLDDARMFFVDPDGWRIRIARMDAYWAEHRLEETNRRLGHAAEACPERHSGGVIRSWTPSTGWTSYEAPPLDRAQ